MLAHNHFIVAYIKYILLPHSVILSVALAKEKMGSRVMLGITTIDQAVTYE